MNRTQKSLFWGIGAGLLLLAFYFLVLTLANSFSHAQEQFWLLRYWILALVVGFGLQVGLYSYIRQEIRQRKIKAVTNKELAASAGVSTGSMVACCAHHLVDVLPIIGLSAVFLFLAEYQVLFLLLGVTSNIVGIIFMLEIVKKHTLYKTGGILGRTSRFNLRALRNWAMVGSSFALLTMFFLIRGDQASKDIDAVSLPSKTNNEGELSIEVRPIDFSFAKPVQFEISLNTHQGNLDFDLTQKAVLSDAKNNQYLPLEWQGEQGGHHLSGILVFPVLQGETAIFKLVIKDVYGIKKREFLWNLN